MSARTLHCPSSAYALATECGAAAAFEPEDALAIADLFPGVDRARLAVAILDGDHVTAEYLARGKAAA